MFNKKSFANNNIFEFSHWRRDVFLNKKLQKMWNEEFFQLILNVNFF